MKNVPGVFLSTDGSGIVAQGHRVLCALCNHDGFNINVIYLTTGDHTHITCTKCGTCFCDQECTNGVAVLKSELPEEN